MNIEGVAQNRTNTNERVYHKLNSFIPPFETNLDTVVVFKIVSYMPTEHTLLLNRSMIIVVLIVKLNS